MYEEFLPTQGTDIKVYTVGPYYAHAEARKAPVLDGAVLRDDSGKERRCPILLSVEEKEMARRVGCCGHLARPIPMPLGSVALPHPECAVCC